MSTIVERAAKARERKKQEEEQRRIEEEQRKIEAEKQRLEEEQEQQSAREARIGELREWVSWKRAHEMLDSALTGLYDEMDKLAKKAPNEPITALQLKIVNSFIKKAKHLLSGDTIIDEVEVFVAAGDMPEYRDVVTVLRQVRQGLERFEANNGFIFSSDFEDELEEHDLEDEEPEDYFAAMNKPQDGTTE